MSSIEISGKDASQVVRPVVEGKELADLPSGLTEEQVLVLRVMSSGRALSEAATAANVHRSTIYRWQQKHEAFRTAYFMVREQMRYMLKADVQSLAEDALMNVRLAVMEGKDPRLSLAVLKLLGLFEMKEEEPVLEPKEG